MKNWSFVRTFHRQDSTILLLYPLEMLLIIYAFWSVENEHVQTKSKRENKTSKYYWVIIKKIIFTIFFLLDICLLYLISYWLHYRATFYFHFTYHILLGLKLSTVPNPLTHNQMPCDEKVSGTSECALVGQFFDYPRRKMWYIFICMPF